MRRPASTVAARSLLLLTVLVAAAPAAAAGEDVDLEVIHRIKDEAFRRSQVMDHLHALADGNGPRLTNSPGYASAARWAQSSLEEWGLTQVAQEPWGEFGRGWSLQRFAAHVVEPFYVPLPGIPLAWTGGTPGQVTAELIMAPLFSSDAERAETYDLEKLQKKYADYAEEHRGKLKGKIVLMDEPRELDLPTEGVARRHGAESLADLADAPEPFPAPALQWPLTEVPADSMKRRELFSSLPVEVVSDYFTRRRMVHGRLHQFLSDEGVVAVLRTDSRGDGGITFAEDAGHWRPDAPVAPPMIALAPEPYSRLARLLRRNTRVRVELEVQVAFHGDSLQGMNVVAEIPGARLSGEVVMLGAHLDSWHAGTGATDNAAGCAVALEAVRILRTMGLKMERTVRLALWGGEEQGLFGSRGYVRQHFGDPLTMHLEAGHSRLSGYFNLDNGSGKIRGVYLQGNDMMRPIFKAWLAPFEDLGVDTISIRDTGGTDHLSFDAVGLPGFQFIQDPLDYSSRTHHSDLDVVDHIQTGDLMQASAVMAAVVYHAATRPGRLPRKSLPAPLPPRNDGPTTAP